MLNFLKVLFQFLLKSTRIGVVWLCTCSMTTGFRNHCFMTHQNSGWWEWLSYYKRFLTGRILASKVPGRIERISLSCLHILCNERVSCPKLLSYGEVTFHASSIEAIDWNIFSWTRARLRKWSSFFLTPEGRIISLGKINPFQIADSFSHSCEIFCGRVTPVIWIDDCLNREWRFCDSCQSFLSFYFMSWRFFPLSQPFLSWLYWHYYIRQNRFDPPPSPERNQIFSVSVLTLMNQRSYLSSRSSWVSFLFLCLLHISLPSHLKYFLRDLEEIRWHA